MKEYIKTIESAYRQMGEEEAIMFPRINVDSSEVPGFLKILPTFLSELGVVGIHAYSVGGCGIFNKVEES